MKLRTQTAVKQNNNRFYLMGEDSPCFFFNHLWIWLKDPTLPVKFPLTTLFIMLYYHSVYSHCFISIYDCKEHYIAPLCTPVAETKKSNEYYQKIQFLWQPSMESHSRLVIRLQLQQWLYLIYICLTSLTRAKCGTRSTLCWTIRNISGSIELFAL